MHLRGFYFLAGDIIQHRLNKFRSHIPFHFLPLLNERFLYATIILLL
jgi:hypothetical protein